ncbi:hypothetical protein C5167_018011 [Papaver somniferum]|uniref:Uncharacterized protein n=1 Tax=Papaver somniferum TaxID=3469 RepID=A0A4Y7IP43_PAPSO|nr:hypothetical protein C5167_018011 [Papaver somniferum]
MTLKPAGRTLKEFKRLKAEFECKGFKLSISPGSESTSSLERKWFSLDQWNDQKIIISLRQLLSGLPIPHYNPQIPLFYELLSDAEIFARNIPTEWKPECAQKEIIPSEYTVENFFLHYNVVIMKNKSFRSGIRLSRKDGFAEDYRIIRDVDFHDNSNNTARKSKDVRWVEYPIILEGPYITGKRADGSTLPLPLNLAAYNPWEFKWTEEDDNKKANKNASQASDSHDNEVDIGDAGGFNDESFFPEGGVPSKEKEKGKDKKVLSESSSKNPAKKRKLSPPTALNTCSLDDALLPLIIPAPHDSLRGVASALTPSFQFTLGSLSARMSYAVTNDLHRKNNFPNDGLENLSLEELRSKYEILKCEHRSLLSVNNGFQRRLHRNKEKINTLEAKKKALITEKDKLVLKGAEALKKFHETQLQIQMERDQVFREKNALIDRENTIRSRLLIENDDEFEWDARVIDNARNNLATNVSLDSDHAELVKAIISGKEVTEKRHLEEIENLKAALSTRNDKCRRLKRKLVVTVSNLSKDALRVRDAAVKKNVVEIFTDHNIPKPDDNFAEVSANEEGSEISYSEADYEEDEVTHEENSDSKVDKGGEDNSDGK